jgi:CubicO group peptidase (beta-lactamase class C family)
MMRLVVGCVLLLLCVSTPPPFAGAEEQRQDLAGDPRVADAIEAWEEWVEYQAAINGVPGMSVGVVHDQELLATNAFGVANPDTGAPARPDTLYSICSISKLFTSVAVLQQRDAGKVRLDDPVSAHVGWFDIQDVHPDDEPITVRGLLTHSSGLPRESDYPYWTEDDYPFPTHAEIVARLGEQQTLYPASRYFQYSNLGLTLAGEVVASASGQPFDEYIRGRILDPLDMKDTFTEVPEDLRGGRLAIGHSARKRDGTRDVIPPFQARGIAPAAGFASNVPDLAKFAMWQFRLLSAGESEVLRASTLREMQRVHWVDPDWKTTWGLGFEVQHQKDRTFVSHGGGCPGYYTHIRLEPKTRIAVIVLTNTIGSEVGFYTAKGFDLIAPVVEKALEDPDGVPVREPGLDRYTGVYDTIWGQSAVVRWEDGLAVLDLGTRDPGEDLVKLKKTREHVFRRVREDDEEQPGEEYVFDVAADGTVTRFKQHSNWSRKVR